MPALCGALCRRTLYGSNTLARVVAFVMTFFSYVSYHATRKSFSNVKPNLAAPYCDGTVLARRDPGTLLCALHDGSGTLCALQRNASATGGGVPEMCHTWFGPLDASTDDLAMLDTGFLFAYALGLYISGWLLDRVNVRRAIAFSMVVAGACSFSFALLGVCSVRAIWPYAIVWTLNGFAQSAGWPGNVAIMAQWFPKVDDAPTAAATAASDADGDEQGAYRSLEEFSSDAAVARAPPRRAAAARCSAQQLCRRGWVLGLWAANASVGNIVGTTCVLFAFNHAPPIAALAPGINGDWRLAMAIPGVLIWTMAGLMLLLLRLPSELPPVAERVVAAEKGRVARAGSAAAYAACASDAAEGDAAAEPATAKQATAAETETETETDAAEGEGDGDAAADTVDGAEDAAAAGSGGGISFWRAWCIPGVPFYALSYLCLKLVNYCLFFWLPLYLSTTVFHHEAGADAKADSLSELYDWGQVCGGFVGGVVSDYICRGRRGIVNVAMMLPVTAALYFYAGAPLAWLYFLIPFAGFMVGGPANLISSAIAADLSNDPSLRGNERATATVVGIIDGTGSLGAAGGGYLLARLANCDSSTGQCNWSAVFTMLITSCFLSVLCLAPIVYKDIRFLCGCAAAKRD